MLGILWRISHELDYMRLPANVDTAHWIEVQSSTLRNPDGKTDNQWLRVCLDRLIGVKLEGEYRGDPWGAVIIAQWEIIDGGRVTRLLVPPAAIQAIRAPKTFAKIEMTAAYKLSGHARRLYGALADKKRMGQTYWEYKLQDLRDLLVIDNKYPTWGDFHRYVLKPIIEEINDFGTVTVQYSTKRLGRSINSVRFDWSWKSIDQARYTDEENQQPGQARHMDRKQSDAPPLTDLDHPIAQHLRSSIEPIKWNSWFKEVIFEEIEQTIKIIAPNAFIREKIKELFEAEIEKAKEKYNSDYLVILSSVDKIT